MTDFRNDEPRAMEAWRERQDARHEARIAIIHNGPLTTKAIEERHERADREHPSTPTHRIYYAPTFVIEVEIAPYEDADEVCGQFVTDWNDNLGQMSESWTEAAITFDTVDLEVENTGSTSSWEAVG